MKNLMSKWFVFGLGLVATTALAQKEQWLQYHTSREGRSYHYVDLLTNPPPNVALPKLNAKPFFARWTTPMDPSGGRWLCLDRSRKSGPYDLLYIDGKGDGRLDNKTAITTTRMDQYTAYFEPARMVFKGEDGPITYHVVLRFMKYEGGPTYLLASSGGYYAGEIDFGGKKRHLELIDGNVNGTFNDQAAEVNDTDRIEVQNDKVGERYLGKLLEVDSQFYRIEVARDGAFVKLQKTEDLEMGKVRVPEAISKFVAFGENGHFVRQPLKGELTLPGGKYRILEWVINRKDNRGAAWDLTGSNLKESANFEVTAGQPATVTVGEPIKAAVRANEFPNRVDFNLSFLGRHEETIQIRKGEQNPPGPRLTIANLDGTYRSTNTFEFG